MACLETFDQPSSFILDQIYTSANDMFSKTHKFDHTSRTGPKVWCASISLMNLVIGTYIWIFTFILYFSGLRQWICCDRKWCWHWKSFSSTCWRWIPYWAGKKQVAKDGLLLIDCFLLVNKFLRIKRLFHEFDNSYVTFRKS